MTAIVDTLKIYERLKNADLNEQAAKEIAEVFREVVDEQLVTKKDLEESLAKTKTELQLSIEKAKNSTIKWVAGMLVAQAAVIAALVKIL
jgi:hypothetical protein